MKNILKKVSAVALSFALLGTGTVIASNTTTPQSTTTLVAEAASGYTYVYCPILTSSLANYGKVTAVYGEYYQGRKTNKVIVYYIQDGKSCCKVLNCNTYI